MIISYNDVLTNQAEELSFYQVTNSLCKIQYLSMKSLIKKKNLIDKKLNSI